MISAIRKMTLNYIALALGVAIVAPARCAVDAEDAIAAAGRVTPAFTRIFIPQGKMREHRVIVDAPGVITMDPLDLLFLIDCSGSMDRQLGPVRAQASRILAAVKREHPDVRFAVASFSDYFPLHSKDPRDYPWRLDQDFTTDAAGVRAAFERIRILHGGDVPESYARALFEAGRLSWRNTARKVVVLFGDSIGHAIDPGPDMILGTADDLRVERVARGLADRGVIVVGVYEPKAPAVRDQFGAIAAVTRGQAIALRQGTDAPAAALAGLARSLRVPPRLLVPAEHGNWIPEIGPARSVDMESSDFAVTLQVPDDARSGRHRVHVVAVQGTDNTSVIGISEIEIVTGWINDPGLQFVIALAIALLPLAVLAWYALRRETWVNGYYFNGRHRWLHLAKCVATFGLVAGYVGSICWTYAKLQEPDAPTLSEWLAIAEQQMSSL